jgi:hypothetical protein
MRDILGACLLLGAFIAPACVSAPPAPERLRAVGPVAVIARLEREPESRLHRETPSPEGAAADRELERVIAALEGLFEMEVRFRGELLDGFRGRPPFAVVPPGQVDRLRGTLLVREEGPPDYDPLARAGIGAVLEVAVARVEVVAAEGDRPAGLRVEARARFVELADGDETWSRELVLEPRPGGPLAFDPAAPEEEFERLYLEALGEAARTVGREFAAQFAGGPRADR